MPSEEVEGAPAFPGVEVAYLFVPQVLQLRILEPELVHDRERMREVPADAVGDDAQVHGAPLPRYRVSSAPTMSSRIRVTTQLSPSG